MGEAPPEGVGGCCRGRGAGRLWLRHAVPSAQPSGRRLHHRDFGRSRLWSDARVHRRTVHGIRTICRDSEHLRLRAYTDGGRHRFLRAARRLLLDHDNGGDIDDISIQRRRGRLQDSGRPERSSGPLLLAARIRLRNRMAGAPVCRRGGGDRLHCALGLLQEDGCRIFRGRVCEVHRSGSRSSERYAPRGRGPGDSRHRQPDRPDRICRTSGSAHLPARHRVGRKGPLAGVHGLRRASADCGRRRG